MKRCIVINEDTTIQYRLWNACVEGNIAQVQEAINKGADINKQKTLGNTAIFSASYWGHKEIVELLLQHGANPYIKNIKGKDALDVAKTSEIKHLLLTWNQDEEEI